MHTRFLVGLLLFAACNGDPGHGPGVSAPARAIAAPAGPHELAVFATASLRRPFEALARRYEQDHPGAKVTLRCEGGAQLFAAMDAGTACDVVAIGDSSLMSRFSSAALLAAGSPTELTRNRVVIVVGKGNPKQVKGLADFARPDLRTALGARSSSIGRHGRWVLSRVPLEAKPACEAPTADGVLARIAAGEADAGIVYVTTLLGAGNAVQGIDVPDAQNTPVLYSISAARVAKEPRGAAAFRELALGPVGQQILHEAGFLPIGSKLP